jgi:hypothetical protein
MNLLSITIFITIDGLWMKSHHPFRGLLRVVNRVSNRKKPLASGREVKKGL